MKLGRNRKVAAVAEDVAATEGAVAQGAAGTAGAAIAVDAAADRVGAAGGIGKEIGNGRDSSGPFLPRSGARRIRDFHGEPGEA